MLCVSETSFEEETMQTELTEVTLLPKWVNIRTLIIASVHRSPPSMSTFLFYRIQIQCRDLALLHAPSADGLPEAAGGGGGGGGEGMGVRHSPWGGNTRPTRDPVPSEWVDWCQSMSIE